MHRILAATVPVSVFAAAKNSGVQNGGNAAHGGNAVKATRRGR